MHAMSYVAHPRIGVAADVSSARCQTGTPSPRALFGSAALSSNHRGISKIQLEYNKIYKKCNKNALAEISTRAYSDDWRKNIPPYEYAGEVAKNGWDRYCPERTMALLCDQASAPLSSAEGTLHLIIVPCLTGPHHPGPCHLCHSAA